MQVYTNIVPLVTKQRWHTQRIMLLQSKDLPFVAMSVCVCVSVCASPWLCVGMQQPIAALKASVDWGYYEIGMPSLAKQAPRTTFKEQKCSLKLANTPQMHMGSDMQTMIAALIKHPPDRIQNFRHASPWYYMIPDTNRTAQGRGGSLKDRKPVGQVWLFCQSPGRIVRESIQLLSC